MSHIQMNTIEHISDYLITFNTAAQKGVNKKTTKKTLTFQERKREKMKGRKKEKEKRKREEGERGRRK